MATIEEIVNYSKANPTSDYAKNAFKVLQTGGFDDQAAREGFDLSWAGRPKKVSPVGKIANVAGNITSNYLLDVGKNVTENISNLKNIIQQNSEGKISPQSATLQTTNELASTLFQPLTTLISAGTQGIADKLSNIPQVQELAQKKGTGAVFDALSGTAGAYDKIAQAHPEAAKNIESLINLGLLALTPEAGGEAKSVIESTVARGKSLFEPVINTVKEYAGRAKANIMEPPILNATKSEVPKTFEQSLSDVKRIINPLEKITPTEGQNIYQTGQTTPHGKGLLRKDVANIKPTIQDEVLLELQNEGKISTKNTPGENLKAIGQEARRFDQNLDELVSRPELNKPFTQKTINKALNDVHFTAKENLTFVPETTEEKAYKQVIDLAKQEIAKQKYNNAGLRTATKAFNAKMERILGNDIYSGVAESVGNARVQAAKDVRKTLYDFLANNLESPKVQGRAPANTKLLGNNVGGQILPKSRINAQGVFRDQLRREALLLNAQNELAFRAGRGGLLGKTKLGIFLKKHPTLKKAAIYLGAGAVGGEVIKSL